MQQPYQLYPYSQHGEWVEATTVHPSIEQRTDHYAAQQVAPRFYPVPPPVQKPPKKHKLLRNKWFWIAIVLFIVISNIVYALGNQGTTSKNPQAAPASTSTAPAAAATHQSTAKLTAAPTQVPTLTAAQTE